MSVTATLASEVVKLLIKQHGSRLVGQEFWNLLIQHLGEVERAYEACERTPASEESEEDERMSLTAVAETAIAAPPAAGVRPANQPRPA